jgi:arylformamidase
VRDAGVDQLPLDVLIGPARVCDLTGRQAIGERELAAGAGSAVRVLLKTENSRWVRSGPVPEVPAPVSLDGARYLVRSGARLVSIDGLSLDHPERVDAHLVLLSAGVVILERVDLSQVSPGEYQLICLPLRLAGADGAPARAVLRSMSQSVPAEPGT